MQIGVFPKKQNDNTIISVMVDEEQPKNWNSTVRETDLHSAFDQIKGNNSCVRGATAHNPTKATQDEILLRAELTTVPLWRNTVETLRTGHRWALTFEEFSWIKHVIWDLNTNNKKTWLTESCMRD